MIWGVTFFLIILKVSGILQTSWFLVLLPAIAFSSLILIGLAGIGLATLYDQEIEEEE
tara:strand:- start:910 stop:1083 length:174 start_codon:yes stop_codon:yes gene_type:complete